MTEITIRTRAGRTLVYAPETPVRGDYGCGGCGEWGTATVRYVRWHARRCHRPGFPAGTGDAR